jgi:hypothetical protein
MPTAIENDSDDLFHVRLSGLLRIAEWRQVQTVAAREIDARGTIKLLFSLEKFEGWEPGSGWGDMQFYSSHGRQIERIAIVGDERWRDQAILFAGAGLRKAAVEYFLPAQSARARTWLSE